jgi:lipid-binding SYLF domain-containing protein
VAINNNTGERVYMRMSEAGVGIGLGVKEYDLVFVIANEQAWNSFTKDDWKVGGSAEAAANDGEDGASLEGATVIDDGLWVYQITKKGLALDASIKGTNIYPDKKLNDVKNT